MDNNNSEQTPVDSATPIVSQSTSQDSGVASDQPITSPANLSSPPKRNNKKLLIIIALLIILVTGVVLAYLHSHKTKASKSSNTATSSQKSTTSQSQKTPTYASVLVFQPSGASNSSTTTILGLDGSKVTSFSSRASDPTYDGSGFSQENLEMIEGSTLLTSDKTYGTYAIVTSDGKSHPVASSLTSLLSANTNPNPVTSLSNGITIGGDTLVGLETSSTDSKLVKINLTSGRISNLFSVVSTKTQAGFGYTPVQLITTSRDGTTAYLITNSVTINATAAPNVSLVTVALNTGKFTIKAIPGVDPLSAAVSKDGKLVAYITSGDNNGYANATTHIYNVQTGKDSTVSTEGLLVSDGAQALRFSPDGAYLSVVGSYAADTHKNGMELQIISTSSHTVVQQVDREGTQYESDGIAGFGWANDHTMIYATNSSTTGNFNPDQEAVHSIDASSGRTFDFPASGELVAVLNYQQ